MSSRDSIKIEILSLFPEFFTPLLSQSLTGKACKAGILDLHVTQIRDFATDKHRSVDDHPYGGGPGMLMRVDVLYNAWQSAKSKMVNPHTILMSPQGEPLSHHLARELSTREELIIVCGHYEGIDERFIELCVDQEISVGDFVLTGGEIPAMALVDAISRFVPGVVGRGDSVIQDSFESGLLKYPQYTRPPSFEGLEVPEVLLSGDHSLIKKWREAQSKDRTSKRRPDLVKPKPLK